MPSALNPMPLLKRAAPFDDPAWIFELKYDGFRALAVIEHGGAQLLSRNGHPFASFSALAESISDSLPNARAVIDGEICSLDRRGRPHFKNLLFRRGNPPCFFAFDLLTCDGKDLRTERLLDRKQELRRLLARSPAISPLKYTEYIDGSGTALFQRICELDLKGIFCQAEIQPLRHRARAHSPQSVPTQEFRKNVNILTLCIASGSLAKEYAESRQRPGCFLRLYVVKSTFFGEVPHEAT